MGPVTQLTLHRDRIIALKQRFHKDDIHFVFLILIKSSKKYIVIYFGNNINKQSLREYSFVYQLV